MRLESHQLTPSARRRAATGPPHRLGHRFLNHRPRRTCHVRSIPSRGRPILRRGPEVHYFCCGRHGRRCSYGRCRCSRPPSRQCGTPLPQTPLHLTHSPPEEIHPSDSPPSQYPPPRRHQCPRSWPNLGPTPRPSPCGSRPRPPQDPRSAARRARMQLQVDGQPAAAAPTAATMTVGRWRREGRVSDYSTVLRLRPGCSEAALLFESRGIIVET